jgi:cytochrome c peroxidase
VTEKPMRSLAVLILFSLFSPLPALAGQPLDPDTASVLADFVRPTTVPYPDDNPYSKAKVELGRKLFFDTALSGDGTRSCATCHAPVSGW